MCVFIYIQLLLEIFLILGKVERDIIINVHMSSSKVVVVLVKFSTNFEFSQTDFRKILKYQYSNIYPTRCNVTQFILSGNCSTCFGWYHHPSSGAQTTVTTASGIW